MKEIEDPGSAERLRSSEPPNGARPRLTRRPAAGAQARLRLRAPFPCLTQPTRNALKKKAVKGCGRRVRDPCRAYTDRVRVVCLLSASPFSDAQVWWLG